MISKWLPALFQFVEREWVRDPLPEMQWPKRYRA